MNIGNGLSSYFHEYLLHQVIEMAREQATETIPISQARRIRARVEEKMQAEVGKGMQTPGMTPTPVLSAIDAVMLDQVPDYEPQFANGTASPRYKSLVDAFTAETQVGSQAPTNTAKLPISPYDPRWAERSSVKSSGERLTFLSDKAIMSYTQALGDEPGGVDVLHERRYGGMMLWRLPRDGKTKGEEAGRAMSYEDQSGLTRLMGFMSEKEYKDVREHVLEGARDPLTGQIDPRRFMSELAADRSVAVLEELRAQGVRYEISRDAMPGQIKASVAGTRMEIRLTDTRAHDEYAGARIYDNGVQIRYATNVRVGRDEYVTYSPTPQEAVDLLHHAQGLPVERQDVPGMDAGQIGTTHTGYRRDAATKRNVRTQVQDAYATDATTMFAVKDYADPENGSMPEGGKVFLQRDTTFRTTMQRARTVEAADALGREAVESARANLESTLDVDSLIAHYEQARWTTELVIGEDGLPVTQAVADQQTGEVRQEALEQRVLADPDAIEAPEFSSDAEVAAIQQEYWAVLTGRKHQLLRPGATQEMFDERMESVGELRSSQEMNELLGNIAYQGTTEDKVRAHAGDVPFEMIGTWDAESHNIDGQWVDQRFDAGRVAKYMTSQFGQWTNQDILADACRRCSIDGSELLGSGFQATRFKDRLARFDEATATAMESSEDEFIALAGRTVRETLERNGMEVSAPVLVDEHGVVSWKALRQQRTDEPQEVAGQIGQIFSRGEHGEIVTQFASDENSLIVPGYEARIVPQDPEADFQSVEERTRLRGYEHLMLERVRYQVTSDVLAVQHSEVGEPASLNTVYSQLQGNRHPVDYIERSMDGDQLDPVVAGIIASEAGRVRYSNEIKQEATIHGEYRAKRNKTLRVDDNHSSTWELTRRNMAKLTGKDIDGRGIPLGYFDEVMTGGATNQGVVRHLTEDAKVDLDGRITPGDPETATGRRAALRNVPGNEVIDYNPFDRQQMTYSTMMQSSKVTEPEGMAYMTFGGWGADDGIVVSDEFARRNQIRGIGGHERDLVVGDKLSDRHGNKGVIALIVDREMDQVQAAELGLEKEVALFRDNPGMDVIMSPFSLVSRRNAGAGRELIDGEKGDLMLPDGQTQAGSLGKARMMVTHMAVDEKTKIYDEEQLRAGKGRKASSQLAWALQSQDCPAIMREFYGHNAGAESNLREYLGAVGLTMDATGSLGVTGQNDGLDGGAPQRRLFEMPELVITSRGSLDTRSMQKSFGELIGDKGGDLELPFALKFPNGESLEAVSDASWKMPVLSSHLRSGQEFDDGTTVSHEYTNRYREVFTQANRYRHADAKLADGDSLRADQRRRFENEKTKSVAKAQRAFDQVSNDITGRVLSEKSNIFKKGIMASRLGDSATMVWSANPKLKLDQIALNPAKAEQLNVEAGEMVAVWRDPMLRDSGLTYMAVVFNEDVTGAAVNPEFAKRVDGDFDGDAVGIAKLHTEAAKAEAREKLSLSANLLELGVKDEHGPNGPHDLIVAPSLDTKVALHKNPQMAEELNSLVREANSTMFAQRGGEDAATVRDRQEDVTEQLSDLYRQAQASEFGSALSFASDTEHVASIQQVCIETGAKGKPEQLAVYERYLDNGEQRPGITQAEHEESMYATAIKAHGTGIAGAYAQRIVKSQRNVDIRPALELTYPATQSVMQAKHNAAEAEHKYTMLQGPGRELLRGRMLERGGKDGWQAARNDENKFEQASPEAWKACMVEFYQSPDGFNVKINADNVDRLAQALTDPKTGQIVNMEEHPDFQGALLDRMAYGGDFETLLEAAKNGENLYDGGLNEQFCSVPTRVARAEAKQMEAQGDLGFGHEVSISNEMFKSDVMAEHEQGAKARGANRRSELAVAVKTASVFDTFRAEVNEPDYSLGYEQDMNEGAGR